MKTYQEKPLYSATDLLNFLGCNHSTALDIEVLAHRLESPRNGADPYLDLLKEKGLDHEREYLKQLRAKHDHVVEIEKDDAIEVMAERTVQAMRDGADVIYQGALTSPGWHGYSDFLIKVSQPSELGSYSYEVVDTKLARSAKPKHVVQLGIYAEMISAVQGRLPDHVHVVVGDGSTVSLKLNDFIYYCRHQRDRFTQFVSGEKRETEADRCPHCSMCHWSDRCDEQWKREGNLRLVAGLTSSQATRLRAAGITTIDALADLNDGVTIPRIQESALNRLRSQAKLQMVKRTTGRNVHEILPLAKFSGFARLPQPNEGDLFFDMEGDPTYSPQGSLEYLFGFHYVENGENTYKAIWARTRQEEKRAFEEALDFIVDRLVQYPNAFIYHYAAYEQTALKRLAREYGTTPRHEDAIKRLAQSYGTRENEVDDLLRNKKLVDLYKVVRDAVRTSEPAYSLKNLEVFFAPERREEIKSGGDSIVAFERWMKCGDEMLLQHIADYNQFDCLSTRQCRDWLISLRPQECSWFDPHKELDEDAIAAEKEQREFDALIAQLRLRLTDGVSESDAGWRELLGYLLEYHRREARSEWWQYFKRCSHDHDPVADGDCIGDLLLDESVPPRPMAKSRVFRFKYPEQHFKLDAGDKVARVDARVHAGAKAQSCEIVGIDDEERWVDVKLGPSHPEVDGRIALIPTGPLDDKVKRLAIIRYVDAVLEGKDSDYAAIGSILRKQKPRLTSDVILPRKRDLLTETVDAVSRMDRTHLVIQGPPGTGKTFTSAHAIVALIEAGKRVGVMSLSHKAINNLLSSIEDVAAKRRVIFKGVKIASKEEDCHNGALIKSSKKNEDALPAEIRLVAGTAWLFSRPEFDRDLDYLFVDEAGQVSLADVVATGLCATNVILIGDQMQLPQPTKGKHPNGSDVSGLEYLTGDWPVIPDDRGVFLDRTWRMHPKLCRFVSAAFYDSRLQSDDSTRGQMLKLSIDSDGVLAPNGLRFIEIKHQGTAQKSDEEAQALARAYRSLVGQSWQNSKGETSVVDLSDILVVTPYNMQVNLLRNRLPAGARIGTVDKFQGQEAAAVLVSMASSSAEDAPRGIDFLLSRNRLNVALSRARCLSVIFCSPKLLDFVCADLHRLAVINTACWARNFALAD